MTLQRMLWSLLFLFLFCAPAYAYIDPGSASIVFQVLIAGFIAIGFVVKQFWRKILAFLGFKKPDDPPPEKKAN